MINHFKYLFFIGLTVLMLGCSSTKNTIPRNLEMIYNPASSSIHPIIKVYNASDTSSVIAGKFFTKELLYNQANSENKLLARVKITYNLYNLEEKDRLIDSSTTTIRYQKNDEISEQYFELDCNTEIGKDYLLEIITEDQNRNSKQYSFVRIDRSNKTNIQDFLVRDSASSNFRLKHTINKETRFTIKHYKLDFDSLNVFYIKPQEEIPLPPYEESSQEFNLEIIDSTYIIYLDSIDYKIFDKEGIYYFTTEDSCINGFSLFNFGYKFPVIQTPKELLKPLEYLGYSDSISNTDSTGMYSKLAVDNFWIDKTNNLNKSRELLQIFYNRVMFANHYFSSFIEGWQSERGMIYIIYGQPDYVFKSDEEEKWIYNPIDLGPGVSFTFKYVKHPMSLNYYILDRKKQKDTGWNEAIKIWNNGEVYYYQN